MRDVDKTKEQLIEELAALRESEARFRVAIENLPFHFFAIDTAGRYSMQNSACKETWGNLIGKRPDEAAVDARILALWQDSNRRAFSGKVVRGEVSYAVKGEKKHYYSIVSPIYSGKEIRGIMGVNIDITERKKALEDLEITQFTIDHVGEGAFWIGPNARLYYVNDAGCKKLGYSRQELLEMSMCDIDPNLSQAVWPQHWEEIRARKSFTFESLQRRKDGTIFPVEINVNYVKYGEMEYNFAFVRDITERKTAQEQLRKAYEEMEERVEERTAELKEKLEELERFRQATIDREFRMEELRRDLERLKKETE